MNLDTYFRTRDTSQDATTPMPIVVQGASRYHLSQFFRDRGYRTGAEVGVYKGKFSYALCNENPGVHHLCVDFWQSYPNGKTGTTIYRSAPPAYEYAKAILAPFDCEFIRNYSVEAAKQVPDKSLDYVYIDANHWFEFVIADIAAWIPKIRPGGVIAGHDWEDHFAMDNRVAIAVKAWTAAHELRPWFVLGRTKARRGEVRDSHRSWMWFV